MPPSLSAVSPSTSARESTLESAFASGETWAFEGAYGAFKHAMFSAALSVLRNREESEDCVHDVLMYLWKRGSAYTPERGSLRAFLTVCVRNEALSRLRKSTNRLRIERRLPAGDLIESPDESVEERDRISGALHVLNEKQRRTIELAYEAHLTHEEIAARLNEPLGTIKSRLSNALRALRTEFAATGEMP